MAIVSLFALIVIVIGGGLCIALQIVLTVKGNKWLGLILPVLSFLLSFVIAFVAIRFYGMQGAIRFIAIVLAITNIPTLIYLGIYLIALSTGNRNDKSFVNKDEISKIDQKPQSQTANKDEINKMKIDDL